MTTRTLNTTLAAAPAPTTGDVPLAMARPARRFAWSPAWPLVVAAGVVLALSLAAVAWKMSRPYPVGRWEPPLLVDAYRVTQGLPVYTDSDVHATHMYGAFTNYLLAGVTAVFGHTVYTARAVSVASSVALVALVLWALRPGRTVAAWALSVGLLVGINLRCDGYFCTARPDMFALLLSTVAAMLLYTGVRQDRAGIYLAGVAIVPLAMMFKQTGAMVAAIPPAFLAVEMLAGRTRLTWSRAVMAALPLIAVGATVVALKVAWPWAFFYMFTVASRWGIRRELLGWWTFELLFFTPAFVWATVVWFRTPRAERDPRANFALAASLVAIPACVLAMAKKGGTLNSALPAALAQAVFVAIVLRPLVERLAARRPAPSLPALGTAVALGLCLAIGAMPHPKALWRVINVKDSNPTYAAVVDRVRSVPGTVVCPDDPSIPMFAKGYAGRCYVVEEDVVAWQNDGLLPSLQAELDAADWLLLLSKSLESQAGITPTLATANGFEPVPIGVETPHYTLWKRKG